MTPLRIAQVAPPLQRVPPEGYGGTERVVGELVRELVRRGHEVTLFASGDSEVPARVVPTVPHALWPAGFQGDPAGYFVRTELEVLRRADAFDVIHGHLEWYGFTLARLSPTPTVLTLHGRLDLPFAHDVLSEAIGGLVAISHSQASQHPDAPWTAVIHNGLSLEHAPFREDRGDGLCFVGRMAAEKGVTEAIEIARLSGRKLRIAAKTPTLPSEHEYYNEVFLKALRRSDAEFLGELRSHERDALFAESYASLLPGAWPEPFGLAAIESLACGTPVVARRVGGLVEILRDGIDGFFGDDVRQMAFALGRVERLDRAEIRRSAVERFSVAQMADRYEAVYATMLAIRAGGDEGERVDGWALGGTVTRLDRARHARRASVPSTGAPAPDARSRVADGERR